MMFEYKVMAGVVVEEGGYVIKKARIKNMIRAGGAYGTRTRDPMRDRHVF